MERNTAVLETSVNNNDLTSPEMFPHIKPDDIAIAVMGVTGVGKSTFISHFNKAALAGDGLESFTQKVGIFEATIENRKLFLIDTPGFDDTNRSDTDVLRELADWLNRSYKAQIKLSGIVYMHRIGDNRMTGAAMKNLRMFKQLCGNQGLTCVVIATTMWSPEPTPKEINREQELTTKEAFWAGMISKGSHVFRQDEGSASAARIIRFIMQQRHRITLQIQEEMASGKTLDETSAGMEVEAEMAKLKKKHQMEIDSLREEMHEAKRLNDLQAQAEIRAIKEELEGKMAAEEERRNQLRVNMDQLQQERDRELAEERQRAVERDMMHKEAMLKQQFEMESLQTRGEYEARLIEANYLTQLKEVELERYRQAEEQRKKESPCVVM